MAEDPRYDPVFKGLADRTRRRILRIIGEHPGINVNEVCKNFSISRIAVVKHIKILEACGLVVSERLATHKLLYLDREDHNRVLTSFPASIPPEA